MRKFVWPLAAMAACAAALAPAAADAATKKVFAGPPKKISSLPEGSDLNDFFPRKVTVARGDSVEFHIRGFHTATFAKRKAPSLFTTDGKPVTGQSDAAGSPFWFNGQDRLIFNPRAAFPQGDGKVTGRGFDGSGLPDEGGEGPPPPYELRFSKTGTFKYVCAVHPGMKGQVKVRPKGKSVPSANRDRAAVATQIAKLVSTAKKLAAFDGPEGSNVRAGNDTRRVSVFKFFPADVTVKAGETVRWQMPGSTSEVHTVTFGPQDYIGSLFDTFIVPEESEGGPPTLVFNPIIGFPSDLPPSTPAYDGANHGNGFLNSGVFDAEDASPLPGQFAATFTKPGTYGYICLIHGPDMSGKVTVTG